jgi:hypothetical protein
LQFGSGSTARDTNLYRSTANTLKTDDNFIADGTVRGNQLLASNTNGLTLYDDVADGYLSYGYNSGRSNTAGHRFYNGITTETARISSTGVLTFGADLDTNLYRSAANTLKTDDSFLAAGDMGCGSDKAFYFGDTGTEGSWRIIRDGNNLVMQRRESSVWTTKQTISA